jgi:hypothetical protein
VFWLRTPLTLKIMPACGVCGEDRRRKQRPPRAPPLRLGLENRMFRVWTEGPGTVTAVSRPLASQDTPANLKMPSHTYKGNAGSQEKDPHQEVFKLLYHQLPQGLPWGTGKGGGGPRG